MILNIVQKHHLCQQVKEIYTNMGKNQEKGSFVEVIDKTKAYEVETDGKQIIFYDYKDPDVFFFDSFEQFKDFVMKEL